MSENARRAGFKFVGGSRPVGAYVARALEPAARARGFATTALLAYWPSIVGAELATFTAPDRVVWPRRRNEAETANAPKARRGEGAVLLLRVSGPRAIEVQNRAGPILERVNGYFGYRAITEMRILQAPVARLGKRPAPPAPPPAEASLPVSGAIEDQGLRRALARLGQATRARLTRG